MKTKDNAKAVTNAAYHRSYFDWGRNMQVVRKGYGEIAMTEGELARFFGVTWKKLNHRLQIIRGMRRSWRIPFLFAVRRRRTVSTSPTD